MRLVSALVLVSFTSSLAAPIVRAEHAPAATTMVPVNTGQMTQNAKVALSDLWGAWVKQGGSSSVKPDQAFAMNFFLSKGATPQQASTLAANAQASGHLSTPLPSSSSAIGDFFKKLAKPFRSTPAGEAQAQAQAAAAQPAATGTQATLGQKIKGIFTGGSSTQHTPPQVPPPGPRPGWGDKAHEGLNRVGDAVHNAGMKVKGAGHDAVSAVTTGLLTAKDKIDIRQFYNIPISETAGVKITGGSSYDVRFTNKGWTQQQVSSGTKLVDAIKANEALGHVKELQTQFGPAQATSGPLGSMLQKFSNALGKFKAKITGKEALPAADAQQLSKFKIEANLLEHAQGLTQVQNAINVRIDKLTSDAMKLGRPVPEAEIQNLRRTLETVEMQKKDVLNKLEGVQRGSASSVVNQGVKWALYSVGITASVNIIKQVVSGEKVDFKSAFSFMGQPSFWAGTAGGFVGSLVVSHLASSLIPGGGIFMKVLPGFLGAALGYEVGAGMFGGGSGDWVGTIGQTLASAGGYALAYSLLGGAMAPGIALIGAGIAAGALFNFIYAKLKGGQGGSTGAGGQPIPPPDLGAPLPDPQANGQGQGAGPQVGLPGANGSTGNAQASPVGGGNLDSAMKSMQQAYNDYINHLKDGKVVDAREAFTRYMTAKDGLEAARKQAVASSGTAQPAAR